AGRPSRRSHYRLHVAHGRAESSAVEVDIDPAGQARILALEHRRPIADPDIRHITQTNLRTAVREHRQIAKFFHGVTDFARVTHADREALQSLYCLPDVFASDRRGDNTLHVGNIEPVAVGAPTVDVDIDVATAGEAFGECGSHTRHVLNRAFDFPCDSVDLLQVRTGHLDAHGGLDSGRQHVDTIANRWHPDVGQA